MSLKVVNNKLHLGLCCHVIKHKFSLYTRLPIWHRTYKKISWTTMGSNWLKRKLGDARRVVGYVRGTLDESYNMLPTYFYSLEQKNSGSVTNVVLDVDDRFQYCLWALRAILCGLAHVDLFFASTILFEDEVQQRFFGIIALDANDQLFSLAFVVVDSENNHS